MPTTTPLAAIATEPPAVSAREALAFARRHYGIVAAEAQPLVSERDRNFRLRTARGQQYVLKIANSAEDRAVTRYQIEALEHIAAVGCRGVAVPQVLRTRAGRRYAVLTHDGTGHAARIVRWVPGRPLATGRLTPALCRSLGAGLAHLGRALSDFRAAAPAQTLLWDLRQALHLAPLLDDIRDAALRRRVGGCLEAFGTRVLPQLPALRSQAIHNDFNPANVLIDADDGDRLAGIIDFGDMQRAPLVIDVAVGAAYLRVLDGHPLSRIADFVAGYHAVTPLTSTEIDLLYDLVRTRLATTLVILEWRRAVRAGDAYLEGSAASEADADRFLTRLSELPRQHAADTLRRVVASVDQR